MQNKQSWNTNERIIYDFIKFRKNVIMKVGDYLIKQYLLFKYFGAFGRFVMSIIYEI